MLDIFIKNQICSLKAVDEAVGALMDALEEEELDNNTIMIFTSDHGFMWGEHRLENKNKIYEESIRVPLVIRYPALISEPRKDNNLVLNIDIAATLAELAGVEPPVKINGKSLVSLLKDSNANWRDDFLIEHRNKLPATGEYRFDYSVRNSYFKYVEHVDAETQNVLERELYDLRKDPFELDNLIDEPSYSEIVKELA